MNIVINNEIRKALKLNIIQYCVLEFITIKAEPTGYTKPQGTISKALDITMHREGITLTQLAKAGLLSAGDFNGNIPIMPTAKWNNLFKTEPVEVVTSSDFKKEQPLECYFDGACEPVNPGGNMGMGWIIVNTNTGHVRNRRRYKVKTSTNSNNVAEYLALYMLLKDLRDYQGCNITIYGDSKLVVNQINGDWQLNSGLHYNIAKRTAELYTSIVAKNTIKLSWIPRERNTGADILSKEAVQTLYSDLQNKESKRKKVVTLLHK